MPGYDVEVIQDVHDELNCKICMLVILDAASCKTGHTYCYECLVDVVLKGVQTKCPECDEELSETDDSIVKIPVMNQMVNKLKVKCSYHGCHWTGDLIDFIEVHLIKCLYQMVVCENKGCDLKLILKEKEQHSLNCKFQQNNQLKAGRRKDCIERNCWVCETPTFNLCSKCRDRPYCSKRCQTQNWSTHKKNCVDPDSHVANLVAACSADLFPYFGFARGVLKSFKGDVFGFEHIGKKYRYMDNFTLENPAVILFGIYQQILKYEVRVRDEIEDFSCCTKMYNINMLQKAYEKNSLDEFLHNYLEDVRATAMRRKTEMYVYARLFLEKKIVIGPTNENMKLTEEEVINRRKTIYMKYYGR